MASIGTLGKTYRCIYAARNYVSGLTAITVRILRPNLVIDPPYPMREFDEADLKGCYYYDFETTKEDPLGDYVFIINNPEQEAKEGVRITYQSETQSVALDTISSGLRKNYFGE